MSKEEPLIYKDLGEPSKPDKLSRQQINQCMMDIEDIHPLK